MTDVVRTPSTSKHLDELRAWLKGDVKQPPIAALFGFQPVEFNLGQTKFVFSPSKRHANPMGTLHGGVICDVADIAMGTAMSSTLEADESFTTLDLTAK